MVNIILRLESCFDTNESASNLSMMFKSGILIIFFIAGGGGGGGGGATSDNVE